MPSAPPVGASFDWHPVGTLLREISNHAINHDDTFLEMARGRGELKI